jgi:DNA-binding transcriptional regulator YiaG
MTGTELRNHRLAFGLSQRELADTFHVGLEQICRWERAGRVPGVVEEAVAHVLEHLEQGAA